MTGAALVASRSVSGTSHGLAALWVNAPAHLLLSALLSFGFAVAYYVDATVDGKILSVLGILLVIGALHAALFHPDRYPLLLVAYLPFSVLYPFGQGESVGVNMTNLLLGLGAVAWISSRVRRPERLPLGIFELLLLIFTGMGLANVALGWALSGGLTGAGSGGSLLDQALLFKRWAMPFALFFIIRGVMEDRRGLTHVLSAMMWNTFLVAALTWWDGTQGVRGTIDGSRVGGILLQANSMGAFLAYYGMAFLGLFLATKGLGRRALYLAGFLVALRASLFTFSRGSYLAFAAGSALVLLLHNPLYLAGVTGVAVSFPETVVPESVRSRIGSTLLGDEDIYDESLTAGADKSVDRRFVLWRAGIQMSRDYPLFGVGLGRFEVMVDQYTEVALAKNEPRDAHNAYLLVAAELGIPALIVMVIVLLWLGATTAVLYFRRHARKDRALPLAFLGTWAATVSSCVWGSRFSDGSVIGFFWILAALLIVLRHLGRTSLQASR